MRNTGKSAAFYNTLQSEEELTVSSSRSANNIASVSACKVQDKHESDSKTLSRLYRSLNQKGENSTALVQLHNKLKQSTVQTTKYR